MQGVPRLSPLRPVREQRAYVPSVSWVFPLIPSPSSGRPTPSCILLNHEAIGNLAAGLVVAPAPPHSPKNSSHPPAPAWPCSFFAALMSAFACASPEKCVVRASRTDSAPAASSRPCGVSPARYWYAWTQLLQQAGGRGVPSQSRRWHGSNSRRRSRRAVVDESVLELGLVG